MSKIDFELNRKTNTIKIYEGFNADTDINLRVKIVDSVATANSAGFCTFKVDLRADNVPFRYITAEVSGTYSRKPDVLNSAVYTSTVGDAIIAFMEKLDEKLEEEFNRILSSGGFKYKKSNSPIIHKLKWSKYSPIARSYTNEKGETGSSISSTINMKAKKVYGIGISLIGEGRGKRLLSTKPLTNKKLEKYKKIVSECNNIDFVKVVYGFGTAHKTIKDISDIPEINRFELFDSDIAMMEAINNHRAVTNKFSIYALSGCTEEGKKPEEAKLRIYMDSMIMKNKADTEEQMEDEEEEYKKYISKDSGAVSEVLQEEPEDLDI